ncbi:MAG: UDP-N-acetylenolpyruvoylglucosamine reductase [Acidimicrobiia bacterium]
MSSAGPSTAPGVVAVARALDAALPGRVARDVPAADLGTYRLGGPIAVLVHVGDTDDLDRVAEVVRAHQPPLLVVGRGSNLLVADRGFAGLGLVLEGEFESVTIAADRRGVRSGAAVALPVLARRCAAGGAGGLEFYVGIPGTVGGAVRMNAGGHGRETREVLVEARVRDLADPSGGVISRSVEDLAFGYRSSVIGPTEVVVEADFRTEPDAPDACAARVDEVVRWRREHQPGGANGGSVFRNPPGDAAGRLIDATGLKGLRVGGAVVSEKHANFFQAEPGATADDVHRLVLLVRDRVADATGVALQPELVMVGFEDGP